MGLIAGGLVGGVVASGSDVFFESPISQNFAIKGIVICNKSGSVSVFNVAHTSGGAPIDGDYLYFGVELDAKDTFREWAKNERGLWFLAPGNRIYVECTTNTINVQIFGEKAQQ